MFKYSLPNKQEVEYSVTIKKKYCPNKISPVRNIFWIFFKNVSGITFLRFYACVRKQEEKLGGESFLPLPINTNKVKRG